MTEIPTTDELWNQAKSLPTTDELWNEANAPVTSGFTHAVNATTSFLGGPDIESLTKKYTENGPYSGSLSDFLFTDTAAGRVLSAMGHGAKDAWGSVPSLYQAELSKEAKDKDASFVKSFGDGLLKPAAAAIADAATHALPVFGGAVSGGIGQTGVELGGPFKDILGAAAEGAIPEGLPEAPEYIDHVQQMNEARYKGVIGEGEEGYFKTRPPTPEDLAAREEAGKEAGILGASGNRLKMPPIPDEEFTVPDIHTLARQVDPETFKQYDGLLEVQDNLRTSLQYWESQKKDAGFTDARKAQETVNRIRGQLQDVDVKLRDLIPGTSEAKNRVSELLASNSREGDMYRDYVQSQAFENSIRLQELRPAVDAAYRHAKSLLPDEATAPRKAAGGEITGEGTRGSPEAEASSEGSYEATDEDKDTVADAAYNRLLKAGRPADEAGAISKLISAHYNARAERFGGKLGSGPELFNKDFPEIRAGEDFPGEKDERETFNQYTGTEAYKYQEKNIERSKGLAQAVKLESEGKANEDIRKETGWFKSPYDGKWRFEVSDEDADLMPSFNKLPETKIFEGPQQKTTLGEILHHPALFEAYPDAKNITVTKQGGLFDILDSMQGWYDDEKNLINITPYAKEPLSVLLHEIQHWVQRKEGFARGGNSSTAFGALSPERLQGLFEKAVTSVQNKIDAVPRQIASLERFKREFDTTESERIKKEGDEAYEHFKAVEHLPYNDPVRKRIADEWAGSRSTFDNIKSEVMKEFLGTDNYFKLSNEDSQLWHAIATSLESGKDSIDKAINAAKIGFVELHETLTKLQAGDQDALKEATDADSAHKLYQSISGEIEARDVQARQGMSPEERLNQEPYKSQGIDPKDAITVFQERKGALTLSKNRNLIRLFKDADTSTFLHETGHQWLEEMFKDAEHPDAPEDLKSDMRTVRDFLGLYKNQDRPTVEQHEKFARSFEAYLREGKAPTKELTSVFEKFKAWLTEIYARVTQLKAPINDDIRGVFDRLVSSPEETQRGNLPEINTGDIRVSGGAARLSEEAINKGLTHEFGGLPEYQGINLKDEISKATKLVNENPRLAIDIALGRRVSTGVHPQIVLQAVKELANQTDDVALVQAIARSPLNKAASLAGQTLSARSHLYDLDPANILQSIDEVKEKSVGEKKMNQEVSSLKDRLNKFDMKWNDFIQSISCDY